MSTAGRHLGAIILDWAGTTIDHGSRAPAGVFIQAFARFEIPITMAQARAPMGLPKREHIARICAMPEVADAWRVRHRRAPSDEDIDRIYAAFIPMQIASLPDFSDLIPGIAPAADRWRARGLGLGATTGYNRPMMEIVQTEAKRRGYGPDCSFCVDDVPAGRPAPWMCFRAAMDLGVYPMDRIVKIGDTLPDIDEGKNAGMWTIAVVRTGNELGLSREETDKLDADELERRLQPIRARLLAAGVHYVVDSAAECDQILDEIDRRLADGERP